MVGATGFEPAT